MSASALLAGAMLVASGGNYVLNLAMARMLDRSEFGDASLMVTWMLALTSVAVGFQLVAVRATAEAGSSAEIDRIRSQLLKRAFTLGVILSSAMVVGSPTLAEWFQTESTAPFLILALGIPAYLCLAVDRGLRQAASQFRRLAASYVIEAAVRVAAASGLVALGFGVNGATWGLTASFVASWLVVRRPTTGNRRHRTAVNISVWRSVGPVGLLLMGQVIINNGDVLLAKWAFRPDEAGAYIAVALVGRAVFFGSWAIVQAFFPAAVKESDTDDSAVLTFGVILVAGFSTIAAGFLFVAGPFICSVLFGPGYSDVAPLLGPYAVAAGLFAVMNLLATLDVARNRWASSVVVLIAGVVQVVTLKSFASSAAQMVWFQVGIMFGALVVLGLVRPASRRIPSIRRRHANRSLITT